MRRIIQSVLLPHALAEESGGVIGQLLPDGVECLFHQEGLMTARGDDPAVDQEDEPGVGRVGRVHPLDAIRADALCNLPHQAIELGQLIGLF